MPATSTPVIVSISCPNRDSALAIGKELLDHRLVACVQLYPVHSIFHWDDSLQTEDEIMIQAKTLSGQLPEIERLVTELHEYEVPEIIATPVIWGQQAYLDWVREEVE